MGLVLVFEAETSLGPEAEGGDGGMMGEHFFVVAVPGHAFLTAMIEVEEAGVEGGLTVLLNEVFEFDKFSDPWQGTFGDAGIGVGEWGRAVPSYFAGGGEAFAEHDDLIMSPSDVLEEA